MRHNISARKWCAGFRTNLAFRKNTMVLLSRSPKSRNMYTTAAADYHQHAKVEHSSYNSSPTPKYGMLSLPAFTPLTTKLYLVYTDHLTKKKNLKQTYSTAKTPNTSLSVSFVLETSRLDTHVTLIQATKETCVQLRTRRFVANIQGGCEINFILDPFTAPEPLPILNPSDFVPQKGFPVAKALSTSTS